MINILSILETGVNYVPLDADAMIARAEPFGYFVNGNTLEPELFIGGMAEAMQEVIEQELPINQTTRDLVQSWVDDTDGLDEERLIKLIERIGKGRFAQALAPHVSDEACPDYIRQALEHIRDAVS